MFRFYSCFCLVIEDVESRIYEGFEPDAQRYCLYLGMETNTSIFAPVKMVKAKFQLTEFFAERPIMKKTKDRPCLEFFSV